MERSIVMSQYHTSLYQLTNDSNLDIDSIYFIVKNFYNDVSNTYQQNLNRILQEQTEEEITITADIDGLINAASENCELKE